MFFWLQWESQSFPFRSSAQLRSHTKEDQMRAERDCRWRSLNKERHAVKVPSQDFFFSLLDRKDLFLTFASHNLHVASPLFSSGRTKSKSGTTCTSCKLGDSLLQWKALFRCRSTNRRISWHEAEKSFAVENLEREEISASCSLSSGENSKVPKAIPRKMSEIKNSEEENFFKGLRRF